jgi:nitrogen regulatory protein PII
VVPVVAIAGLRAVDVPLGRRVARADDLFHQHQGTGHHRAAGFARMEEVFLVDLLRLGVVADEDEIDLVVVPCQEQVQQDEETLGKVFARFVHRARDVHQAEHHRLGGGHRHLDAVAKAQIDRVEIGDAC